MKNRSGRMLKTLFRTSFRRSGLNRALRGEMLETRDLMAGDTYLPYHNDLIPEDTNQDYNITALDALVVINALNAGQGGQLVGPGVGKADGPRVDVSGDNNLTAIDALRVINRLNGEGEIGDIVGFRYELTDLSGNVLPNNTASVDQLVQLRTYVQDLRTNAQGVFTAFLDIDYSDASKFDLNVGEGQSFKFMFDKLQPNAGSNFKFTYGGATTAAVSLYNNTTLRSAAAFATLMQTALEALPTIGAGNVIVKVDAVAANADSTAGILRRTFDIIFVNNMAGKNVDLIGVDTSGVVLQAGQTLESSLVDKFPADPSNPAAVAASFRFSDEFTTGRNAVLGTNQFDEVGATGGLGTPTNPEEERLFFTVTLRTKAAGSVTFTPNPAEDFPAHETLVFPKDVVPTSLIEYNTPFTLTIASGIIAGNDTFTVAEDTAAADYNVTANDSITAGTSFTITSIGSLSNGGTATISQAAKQINYKPAANFSGTETFTYTVTNNLGNTATATVTMTVTAVNDPVSIPAQTAATNLGKALTLTAAQVTVGGTAGPGEDATQTLSVASVNSPSTQGGTVALNAGSVVYTPKAGFAGTDSFTIVVTDNGQTNGVNDFKSQTVTVSVTVTNDPPNAVDDPTETVDEDTPGNLNVLANDTAGANDVNDSLTITATGGSPSGTVSIAADGKSINYTPAAGFVGSDTFTYTVRDTGGLTDTATVTVEVQATTLPRARTDNANATEDVTTPVTINVLGNDRTTAGSKATLISFTQPANGDVALNDNGTPADLTDDTLTYVPKANFSGRDVFTYVMNEDPATGGANSTGTVTVTVADVNDAPVLANDTASATEDTVATITATSLLSNDSPGVGETASQTLTITSVQAVSASGGTVALSGGNVVYTPAADFNGQFVFAYTATDSGTPALTGTATVTVSVAAVNDAPVAAGDAVNATEDTTATIAATTLLTNDRPGPATATDEASQTLTIVAVGTSAQGGTVALNNGGSSINYTPAANFFGTDTFTYTIRDNGSPALQSTATVTVTVAAVNDAPTAGADTVGTSKGVAVTIPVTTLLSNDSPGPANEASQTITVTAVSNAVNGTVSLVGGQVVFTPTAGFSGAASFDYTVTDNGQSAGQNDFKTATGRVTVNVQDFQPSSISGMVFVDETDDGIKQAAERSLGGVIVNLTGVAQGINILGSYTTLADGSYTFGDLAPGTYTVSFVNPTLMIDGKDTAGNLGDADGVMNNNSFSFTIGGVGGLTITGYNFGVVGVSEGYASVMERLASRYFASGSTLANNGLYAVLSADGSQKWFSQLNGFDGIEFAEVALNTAGTEGTLTIVDSAHNVKVANLVKGKFLTMHDNAGNTVVRVLGGLGQLQFTQIDLTAPPVKSANRFLDAIDHIFSQEGW